MKSNRKKAKITYVAMRARRYRQRKKEGVAVYQIECSKQKLKELTDVGVLVRSKQKSCFKAIWPPALLPHKYFVVVKTQKRH